MRLIPVLGARGVLLAVGALASMVALMAEMLVGFGRSLAHFPSAVSHDAKSKCPDCGAPLIGMYLRGVRCSAWPKCGFMAVGR